MCIAAQKKDPRKSFKRLNELEKQCRPESQGMLSMGMSEDYEIAIQEGATHIRIGTALFGQRESFFKEQVLLNKQSLPDQFLK
jgi:uncharacterized pyridoxal phosphate-containing UPF0001 family protein